jgi:hypothetical protein
MATMRGAKGWAAHECHDGERVEVDGLHTSVVWHYGMWVDVCGG